ncbi:Hypothetical protein PENO1_026270 [Penicillium occitanis (nom. inval.)]|nr:Hypothetical protein PENO1_026270 [Penicillium occitanis (nom. inval.)]PCH05286.1 hypothetical protein PENOC_029590 [Penicillium occitanis (nom. inval.)]
MPFNFTVLILGVTSASGAIAVLLARELGAGKVIRCGRNIEKIATLGLDGTVPLLDTDVAGPLIPHSLIEEIRSVYISPVTRSFPIELTLSTLKTMATSRESPPQSHLWTLIAGSHILHYHGILDAYGHLSVRHPDDCNIFVMPRNIAPGTLSLESDLVKYHVSDASPVSTPSPAGYAERFIHSEIYKRFPEVQSVAHSHAPAVIPYTVPLEPCFHMAGFLGSKTPVFDIADYYRENDTRDLLVRDEHLGAALASHFSKLNQAEIENDGQVSVNRPKDDEQRDAAQGTLQESARAVVLMRGHGLTVVGASIEECVFRAIYTAENAAMQTASLAVHSAYFEGKKADTKGIRYLRSDEHAPSEDMTRWTCMRPWNLWLREIESSALIFEYSAVMLNERHVGQNVENLSAW